MGKKLEYRIPYMHPEDLYSTQSYCYDSSMKVKTDSGSSTIRNVCVVPLATRPSSQRVVIVTQKQGADTRGIEEEFVEGADRILSVTAIQTEITKAKIGIRSGDTYSTGDLAAFISEDSPYGVLFRIEMVVNALLWERQNPTGTILHPLFVVGDGMLVQHGATTESATSLPQISIWYAFELPTEPI